MRWLVMLAVMLAAPGAMAQSPAQCRAVDAAIGEFLRAERAQGGGDASIERQVSEFMQAAMARDPRGSIPLRTDATTALAMIVERREAKERAARALEDLQHRARLCARQ